MVRVIMSATDLINALAMKYASQIASTGHDEKPLVSLGEFF